MPERTTETINGREYELGKMNAFTQLHVARRLAPGIAHLTKMVQQVTGASKLTQSLAGKEEEATEEEATNFIEKLAGPIAEAFSKLSDEDTDYVIKECLKVCYFKHPTGWAPLTDSRGNAMLHDLTAGDLVAISMAVIKENMGGFFPSARPSQTKTERAAEKS